MLSFYFSVFNILPPLLAVSPGSQHRMSVSPAPQPSSSPIPQPVAVHAVQVQDSPDDTSPGGAARPRPNLRVVIPRKESTQQVCISHVMAMKDTLSIITMYRSKSLVTCILF